MKIDKILETIGLKEMSRAQVIVKFTLKYWWLWCLIAITIFSFWSRMIPAKYGELQALDPFYAYRMNLHMLENDLQLPLHDSMRYWPDGIGIEKYGPLVYFYVPVMLYISLSFIGVSMTYLQFAIMYPALMGAVSVFFIFWLAREIFKDEKAALFASLFLATVPGYIARTSAGFFDKEATGGAFFLIALFLFMRSYNRGSFKISALSGIFIFLAMGSWGGGQFLIYTIAVFMIVKLLINKYEDKMVYSAIVPLIVAVLTQRFFLGISSTFEQVIAILTIILIVARYAAEKYKILKEEQLPYLVPAIMIIVILSILIGSMFFDFMWHLVNRGLGMLFIQDKGYIGSTVAEQMQGTWADVTSRTSVNYSKSVIPLVAPFDTFFSIWFLFIMGSLAALYNIYTERNWALLFPLLWLFMSIQTVFYMVRLVFFLGPPASIMAGYFLADIINRLSRSNYMKKTEGLKKMNILSIPLIIAIAMIITSNIATGYVFCNSLGPSFNQYWKESMDYLAKETPVNSSILSWWDFGYWFQTRGERPSIADGGNNNGTVNSQIADWYVSNTVNWTDFRSWFKGKDVSYILMDYTLPGKYGAISKIASRGRQVTGMLQFQQTNVYPQQNKTIIEYKADQYTIWMPVGSNGNIAGNPIFMVSQGDQYLGRNFIEDICTTNGIVKIVAAEGADVMPGCVTITSYGLFYIPPETEFSIFTNLMFMDGYGIPDIEKVFDNQLIKIYKLDINETPVNL